MTLFAKNKERAVQGFVLKLVNNNCPELRALAEGPRGDGRVNLVIVAMVIPLERGKPMTRKAFTAVTKEFSCTGVALVVDRPRELDEVFLGFRIDGEMRFIRAKAKHLSPLGGGFFQLGFHMLEVLVVTDYPQLGPLSF
jgi:hypothetical protein